MMVSRSILDDLRLIQPGSSFAIFIRHAERREFRIRQLGNNVPITSNGIVASIKFGCDPCIKTINGVYSSPVLRCVETAHKIMQGADLSHLKVETRKMLGEPGSFIVNQWVAGRYFFLRDPPIVFEEFLEKGILDGFQSVKDGSTSLLSAILKDIGGRDARRLYISHDAVIVPFIFYFTGEKFGRAHWLDFLDGIIITVLDGEVKMIRNGKEYVISSERYPEVARPFKL